MSKIKSYYKNKQYNTNDTVRLLNQRQATYYWSKGIEPLDIYLSKNFETDEPIIVYVFSREQTKDIYNDWCNREIK